MAMISKATPRPAPNPATTFLSLGQELVLGGADAVLVAEQLTAFAVFVGVASSSGTKRVPGEKLKVFSLQVLPLHVQLLAEKSPAMQG